MVEATPTTLNPSFSSAPEPVCEPLPPMTTSASTPRLARFASALARPERSLNSGLRALPSTVPPCCTMPPTSRALRGSRALATRPAKPLRTPNTSQPWASAPRVTARTAAFMPGASPPLVKTAIFFKPVILKLEMAKSLKQLREDARACQDCPLWANATQTVFGAGDPHARVMLVGEQPGDEEDKKGLPFVGPAGRLLDRALEAAGVDREHLYVTNAVKHFKWQARGKRRLHKTPAQREIDACHQWLESEIKAGKPHVIVALGATAAKAIIGPQFKVSLQRGQFVESPLAPYVFATFHPSALLRLQDEAEKEAAFA